MAAAATAAATAAARDHIWSLGVSLALVSRYLLAFYKLFLFLSRLVK